MSNAKDERDVYYIPPNFLTSGRLFGGMMRVRNAIEACVLVIIQAIPLKDAAEMELASKDDLAQEDLLERMDVKAWYQTQGESILCQMIDDLNTQGHKRLLVKDNGEVVIEIAGQEESVELLKDFPPRMVWDDFCHLLNEDEITASIQTEGLLLTW